MEIGFRARAHDQFLDTAQTRGQRIEWLAADQRQLDRVDIGGHLINAVEEAGQAIEQDLRILQCLEQPFQGRHLRGHDAQVVVVSAAELAVHVQHVVVHAVAVQVERGAAERETGGREVQGHVDVDRAKQVHIESGRKSGVGNVVTMVDWLIGKADTAGQVDIDNRVGHAQLQHGDAAHLERGARIDRHRRCDDQALDAQLAVVPDQNLRVAQVGQVDRKIELEGHGRVDVQLAGADHLERNVGARGKQRANARQVGQAEIDRYVAQEGFLEAEAHLEYRVGVFKVDQLDIVEGGQRVARGQASQVGAARCNADQRARQVAVGGGDAQAGVRLQARQRGGGVDTGAGQQVAVGVPAKQRFGAHQCGGQRQIAGVAILARRVQRLARRAQILRCPLGSAQRGVGGGDLRSTV